MHEACSVTRIKVFRQFAIRNLLVFLVLSVAVFGCDRSAPVSETAEKRVSAAAVLSGENEPLPQPPLLQEEDSLVLGELGGQFFSFIRRGKKQDAVELFLPEARRTAEKIVAKDIEFAAKIPGDYTPSNVRYVWYQDGKLWFRRAAEELTDEEINRLIALSEDYEKAFVMVVDCYRPRYLSTSRPDYAPSNGMTN